MIGYRAPREHKLRGDNGYWPCVREEGNWCGCDSGLQTKITEMTSLQGAYPPVFRLERSLADCNFVIRQVGYCCIVKGIPASTCFWLGFLTSSMEHSDIRILALGLTSLMNQVSAAQWCGAGQGRYVGPARWVMKVNKRVKAQDVLLCRPSLMKTNESLTFWSLAIKTSVSVMVTGAASNQLRQSS